MCRRFNSYQHHVKDRLHGLSFFVPGPRYHYLFWSFSHHARPARESYQPHQPRPFPRPSRPSLPLLVSPIMPTHARILPATPAAPCAASQAPEAARYRAAGSLGLRPGYGGGRRHFSGTSKPLRGVRRLKVRHQPHGRARDFSEGKVVEGEKAAGGSGEALLPPYDKPPRRARRSAIWRIL